MVRIEKPDDDHLHPAALSRRNQLPGQTPRISAMRSPSTKIRESCGLAHVIRSSALPAGSSCSSGDRARGEQDKHSVGVARGRDGYRPVRCRLGDAPRGVAGAEAGKPAECRVDVNEEPQQQEPAASRRGRRPLGSVAVEQVELQDAGMIVGNCRVTEEDCSQEAAGSVEETWPPAADRPVSAGWPHGRVLPRRNDEWLRAQSGRLAARP